MFRNSRTITVLGAGYVGLTTAAILAHSGYKVYAVEPNPDRLHAIQSGRSFFFEDGLDPIIKSAIDSGNLIATSSYADSVPNSQVIFSSVGTPDNPDGSLNLDYVFTAAQAAANDMADWAIFVQKSTVPVGTGSKIEALFNKFDKHLSYVSNPEFLREGTALSDTLYFDRIVVGSQDKIAARKVINIYKSIEANRDKIAKLAGVAPKDKSDQYITTSLSSAELVKVASNAFLAQKISFANSIAKLSDTVGADINEVMDAVGADSRIGRAFLSAGRGYGGGCFPKDVSGLIASGFEKGVDLSIMTAAQQVNESMPGYIIDKLQKALKTPLNGKKATVLGLSFKAGTSDVRKSPGVRLANLLAKSGSIVKVYDPQASQEAARDFANGIETADSIISAVDGSDLVVVATDWPEFINFSLDDYGHLMEGKIFVDAVNKFSPAEVTEAGLHYIGVGR
jgi:UDPglucose 6-dehydrogenase